MVGHDRRRGHVALTLADNSGEWLNMVDNSDMLFGLREFESSL